MASFADGFDDEEDESGHAAPEPDDRLWRHPSELGGSHSSVLVGSVGLRHRWSQDEPSRASAWTAGIVGALLATGLVVLGTHLATAITSPPMATQAVSTAPAVLEPSISPLSELGQTHLSEALSTTIRSVGASVMSIEVDRAGIDSYFLGVVIRPDGLILAPASPLAGAMSVLVNLPGGVPYVGTVVGSDPTSGLAVVHINGVNNLHAIRLGSQVAVPGEVTFAITSAGGANIALGTVKSANVDPDVGGAALIDVLSTDIESSISPSGSVLVNAHGRFVGIVTGVVNGAVVATPSWLASRVASELAANGKVVHGWLGMLVGKNVQANAQRKSAGVLVENVAPDSTAGIAGLSQGDEIVSINGHPVTSLAALRGRLYVLAPNTRVGMGIWRNGLKKTLEVSLGADEPN